ncbi:response regulator [Lachnospiraceae bacterium OttesenSCG-928-D06]|nr:response regulator [Lachnospiraceae bacterium OttesenSCG-928-D06]
MKKRIKNLYIKVDQLLIKHGIGMRVKLILMFLVVQVVPLILLASIAWQQINVLGEEARDIAVADSAKALNDIAVENIERMSTDAAKAVADFLYARDSDLLYLAGQEPSEELYRLFAETKTGKIIESGDWVLSEEENSWIDTSEKKVSDYPGVSTNKENEDMDGFHYREGDNFEYREVPYYDEITFVDLNGMELIKVTTDSTKVNYQMSTEKRNVSNPENTYIKAEHYFEAVSQMEVGEIYVSDVIGAYVGTNYIGMYTPENVEKAAETRGYDIEYLPEEQAYSGEENPYGTRFEGIVRFATPVADEQGEIIGYVTFALNHDHIMEFVDHLTPMTERYTELPSAYDGNYAFIWDYQCRSICHPRHHSIVGYNPETGEQEIPWLESSIYDGWQESGEDSWISYVEDYPIFYEQSRTKTPAAQLTKDGYVGLDGRYLNNAPQCTGWMDLTQDGGSGSFYILWSGLTKLNTAAAIPYYTGQYAPSEENGYSKRGFGFVAIGAGLEDFTKPAVETETRLTELIDKNLTSGFTKLALNAALLVIIVCLAAVIIASSLTGNITKLIYGISRFRSGERQFRFDAPVKNEFGTLADAFDDMAESISKSVKNPMSIINMNDIIIYMNEHGLEFRNKTLDEVVGAAYSDHSVYPPGTEYDPILALENGIEAEIFYYESAKQYLKGTANYFYDKDGQRIGYIVETIDVTDMVLQQKNAEDQRALFNEIFNASPDLTWYLNSDLEYVTVNPRFADLVGIPTEEIQGRRANEVLPKYLADILIENDRKTAISRESYYTEEKIRFADDHIEILDAVRTPVFDSAGDFLGVLGFARNVTSRVKIENDLRQAQIDLEQAVETANAANAHKGEFLARMSHEIRTPMNAIIGVTGIVQKKLDTLQGISEQDKETQIKPIRLNMQQIEASSQHLLGLLNDILDLSKIEAGKIELLNEIMDIHKLTDTVTTIIKPKCDEKNITFLTTFDDFPHKTFSCDTLRLRQVLINLLGNAVKFTPENGEVELGIKQLAREKGRTKLHFYVKDNGIGVSDEAKAKIFQPFEQESGNVSKQYGGTGLGLAISLHIVELFGGKIMIDSILGEGSTFSFDIWLTETREEEKEIQKAKDITGRFAGKKMLLVDDVDINRMIVMEMLEDTGIEIEEAGDGIEALALFEESEISHYDVIFMDVQMPRMDGYQASMAIRQLDREDAKKVPIVTLTANAFKEDIKKAKENGMNEHLSKPIEIEKMLEVLCYYL